MMIRSNNKQNWKKSFVKIKLRDLFGFADQEEVPYGLGCNLTLKRYNNNDCIIRDAGVDAARKDIKRILVGIYQTIPLVGKANNSLWNKY